MRNKRQAITHDELLLELLELLDDELDELDDDELDDEDLCINYVSACECARMAMPCIFSLDLLGLGREKCLPWLSAGCKSCSCLAWTSTCSVHSYPYVCQQAYMRLAAQTRSRKKQFRASTDTPNTCTHSHAYIYACIIRMRALARASTGPTRSYLHIYIHTCRHAYIHTYIYRYTNT
jgi:hypothetical protein